MRINTRYRAGKATSHHVQRRSEEWRALPSALKGPIAACPLIAPNIPNGLHGFLRDRQIADIDVAAVRKTQP